MATFSEGQEVSYQGQKYTVTKVTAPQPETTYELTPVPEPVTPIESVPESQIQPE